MSVIGLRVGPYEILEGADVPESGAWFLARRTAHNRKQPDQVLVRLMPRNADEGERAALQNYFERMRKLEDPRIPQAIGYFEGIGAVAIECVRGINLATVLEHSSIEVSHATALDIVIEICEAINHAHNRGLIHGAIQLNNIIISDSGQIWVFGLGLGPDEPVPADWIAPERVAGGQPTQLTDQWSIAAIATTLVTGEAPWRAKYTPSASDTSHLINEISLEWPGLARVLTPMLESNPAHRYDTLQKARQELLALSRQLSTRADRRELSRKLHEIFAEAHTFDDNANTSSIPTPKPSEPTMPVEELDSPRARAISIDEILAHRNPTAHLNIDKLVDEAVQLVKDDLMEALNSRTEDSHEPDLDSPSFPGYAKEVTEAGSSIAHAPDTITYSDEKEAGPAATAVPETEISEFSIGKIDQVRFTDPGGAPQVGDPLSANSSGSNVDVSSEPLLPKMDLDSPINEVELPPRERSLIVRIAPFLTGFAIVGMVLYYLMA